MFVYKLFVLDGNTWKHMTVCKLFEFMGSGRGQGKLCCRLISDSILRLYYFYPTLSCWCNSLNKKAQKELYERRQQQIGDEDVFFFKFFFCFLGSTTIQWEKEFSQNQLKWLNPPVKVFKNTLIVSWYHVSSFDILKL